MNTFWWIFNAALVLTTSLAHAGTSEVTVGSQTVTTHFEAYGQIEPIAILPVRAAKTGIVTGIKILPGASLKAGQALGKLGGPEIQALISQRKAELNSAQAQLVSAKKSLTFRQQQFKSQLATRLQIFRAESVVAQAQSVFDTAKAQLRGLRETITLKAPVDGIVLSVDAADGERVTASQPVITLQPANRLWLRAAYYGTDAVAIHVGMSGQFFPADGGKPLPVKVSTVFAALMPDGGESVGLLATRPVPGWRNGAYGTVTLNGPSRSLEVIPTRALILDQGQWWVLVHTASGNHPQRVTPGPARGWQTFIEHGLEPGMEVVVENAYLEFHRSISQHYQQPD